MCEMECQQSRVMTGMAWLYEASPSFQYAGIPRPVRPLASSTAPGWAGGSHGDIRGGPYPGEETHAPAPSSGFPHTLDRGRYTPVGEGQSGQRNTPKISELTTSSSHYGCPFEVVPPGGVDAGRRPGLTHTRELPRVRGRGLPATPPSPLKDKCSHFSSHNPIHQPV